MRGIVGEAFSSRDVGAPALRRLPPSQSRPSTASNARLIAPRPSNDRTTAIVTRPPAWATLRTSTCGGLAEFYATVDPAKFAEIHELAEQQGSVPVVTSVDKVQITDSHAIVQVTAHPAGTPTDVAERTFDLSEVGGEWKVCGE